MLTYGPRYPSGPVSPLGPAGASLLLGTGGGPISPVVDNQGALCFEPYKKINNFFNMFSDYIYTLATWFKG